MSKDSDRDVAERHGGDRRRFLQRFGLGLGAMALADLWQAAERSQAAELTSAAEFARPPDVPADSDDSGASDVAGRGSRGVLDRPHLRPRAQRVIFLFQSGGPSQLDLWDHKPVLNQLHGSELPESVRGQQRLTGMSGNQSTLPLAGSPFAFRQHGEAGCWVSELLPHTAAIADDLCVVRSLHTDAINHGPGVNFIQTGSPFPGRPSIGAWVDYGLGSESEDLPAYVVLVTKGKSGQPLASRYWGNGFLPSRHQAVRFRSDADPVLYLNNPAGISREARENELRMLTSLHRQSLAQQADPAIEARIAQHEMAFRMQASIPEATDFSDEPASVLDLYGPDVRTPGSYAANCLQARRLAQRGVRFIQLFHQDWDHHGSLPGALPNLCRETDRPSAALVRDLRQHGLLDDTLVIWAGEFGRTNYCQGPLTANSFGRDHHPRCFSIWMAGAGLRGGLSYGETDDFGYNIVDRPVHVHDFQATILHALGIDHTRLTYRYQGRQFRLTDVHGEVIHDWFA